MKAKATTITLTAMNAALYATVGYMTFLGIFTPVIGVVRFWPGVFIPAVFATLFGPWVGGIGAAIGIFISDLIIHGNALLSLTVGVPANFIMFYLIGHITGRRFKSRPITLAAAAAIVLAVLLVSVKLPWESGEGNVWILVATITMPLLLLIGALRAKWTRYQFASTLGNAVGSLVVGFGVWGYSQFFILPSGGSSLPIMAAYMWVVWTFMNQIPFLVLLGPPVLKACEKTLPAALYRRELG
ncbi:MAG: hypothetical protein QXO32_04240 [Candidatus Bathyarchaeia archaeon]